MIGTGESLSVPVLAQGLLPGPPRGVEEGGNNTKFDWNCFDCCPLKFKSMFCCEFFFCRQWKQSLSQTWRVFIVVKFWGLENSEFLLCFYSILLSKALSFEFSMLLFSFGYNNIFQTQGITPKRIK